METSQTQADADNIFRFLVATDTHLGHREKDPIRGNDSFVVFEEIIRLALCLNVDFLLHGGDLFDLHKPSRSTMYRTMNMLREFCLMSAPRRPSFQILNSQTRAKIFKFGRANFECSACSINLPIFGIHGNHDDPGEEAFLSPMDLLEAANLLTYFGWTESLEEIQLHPILLKKGESKIALYGLGNIRDERLHRAFQLGKVTFHPPEIGSPDEYFHIMVIHQNRYKGSFGGLPNKNCIHEQMLPKHLDLVIWGHEHDCILSSAESDQADFHVIQPGSSVSTSLSQGEAEPKHVVLLEIRRDTFRSTFVPLRNVRPLQYKDVFLSEITIKPQTDDMVAESLRKEVEDLIWKSKEDWKNRQSIWAEELTKKIFPAVGLVPEQAHPLIEWMRDFNIQSALEREVGTKGTNSRIQQIEANKRQISGHQRMKTNKGLYKELTDAKNTNASEEKLLPCIRLRVEYSGFDPISSQRFGAQFVGRVANPNDILLFFKKRKGIPDSLSAASTRNLPELEIEDSNDTSTGLGVQDLIYRYLNDDSALEILAEPDFNVAVQDFVHKMESSAIDRFVGRTVEEAQGDIKKTDRRFTQAEEIRPIIHARTERVRQLRAIPDLDSEVTDEYDREEKENQPTSPIRKFIDTSWIDREKPPTKSNQKRGAVRVAGSPFPKRRRHTRAADEENSDGVTWSTGPAMPEGAARESQWQSECSRGRGATTTLSALENAIMQPDLGLSKEPYDTVQKSRESMTDCGRNSSLTFRLDTFDTSSQIKTSDKRSSSEKKPIYSDLFDSDDDAFSNSVELAFQSEICRASETAVPCTELKVTPKRKSLPKAKSKSKVKAAVKPKTSSVASFLSQLKTGASQSMTPIHTSQKSQETSSFISPAQKLKPKVTAETFLTLDDSDDDEIDHSMEERRPTRQNNDSLTAVSIPKASNKHVTVRARGSITGNRLPDEEELFDEEPEEAEDSLNIFYNL